MKLLVCGSRKWKSIPIIHHYLGALGNDNVLIHGNAQGADKIAAGYAEVCEWEKIIAYPARWAKYGKSAGPIRNQEMLKEAPDIVVAFRCGKVSTGTDHMVAIARKEGILTVVIDENGEESFE